MFDISKQEEKDINTQLDTIYELTQSKEKKTLAQFQKFLDMFMAIAPFIPPQVFQVEDSKSWLMNPAESYILLKNSSLKIVFKHYKERKFLPLLAEHWYAEIIIPNRGLLGNDNYQYVGIYSLAQNILTKIVTIVYCYDDQSASIINVDMKNSTDIFELDSIYSTMKDLLQESISTKIASLQTDINTIDALQFE